MGNRLTETHNSLDAKAPRRARPRVPTDLPPDWRHFAPRGDLAAADQSSDRLTACQGGSSQGRATAAYSELVGADLGAAGRNPLRPGGGRA